MDPKIAIRWATPADAREIAAVHIASWLATYRGLMPGEVLDGLTLEGRERDWQGWLGGGGDREFTLVADRDGPIEAFCTIEFPSLEDDEPETVAGIPALYARPDAIGRGFGPALMEAALAAIRERGYREAILWVLAGNHRAQAFYERRGWSRDGGDRPGEYPGVKFASAAERPREIRYRHRLDA